MINFRPYQESAIQTAREKIASGKKSILLNAPTGSGKTIIATGIIQLAVAKGKRVLFMAHRRELIDQCCEKLKDAGILNFGVIMSKNRLNYWDSPVQVASIQTVIRRELPPADLIFIDEAHRAKSKSYLSIIANYPNAVVLGLTATPERLDGKGLDDIFNDIVVVETVPNLIEQGYLIKPKCYIGPTPDLKGIKSRNGDYDESELAEAMDKPKLVGNIIENWKRLAKGKKTAVFAVNIEHGKHIVQEFIKNGVSTAMISGKTPIKERDSIITDWRAGFITIVVNVYVLVEGFDMPELECIIMARPTQSISLYLQAAGRVMRPASCKKEALLLDHAGVCQSFGHPALHREWTLDGMAKRRNKNISSLAVCQACQMAYEVKPSLWVAEMQPDIKDEYKKNAQLILRSGKNDRAASVCPGCGSLNCKICNAVFKLKTTVRVIDDIAYQSSASCPACNANYEDDVHITENKEKTIPDSTNDQLIEMGDAIPQKVLIHNEYKILINLARQKGYKRGWAYWQMRKNYDESTIRAALPRHTADWWRVQA
ncbi:MAG: DEAD/DEAH box helicase [Desulfobacterales bacterium]|nr:DEAD/DEAH box helicase [Desulfobacterales bacterium]